MCIVENNQYTSQLMKELWFCWKGDSFILIKILIYWFLFSLSLSLCEWECVWVCEEWVCECVCCSTGSPSAWMYTETRCQSPESQVAVNQTTWVLGTQPGSFARALSHLPSHPYIVFPEWLVWVKCVQGESWQLGFLKRGFLVITDSCARMLGALCSYVHVCNI